jgi:hypothetical protein
MSVVAAGATCTGPGTVPPDWFILRFIEVVDFERINNAVEK